jgi:hypothetical protein
VGKKSPNPKRERDKPMSLNYDATAVKDWEQIKDNQTDYDIFKTICFLTMNTGINEITLESSAEFWVRVKLIEDTRGKMLMDKFGQSLLTLYTIRRFIGLKTNASKITKTAWMKSYELTAEQKNDYSNYLEIANAFSPVNA